MKFTGPNWPTHKKRRANRAAEQRRAIKARKAAQRAAR